MGENMSDLASRQPKLGGQGSAKERDKDNRESIHSEPMLSFNQDIPQLRIP
jgi:hypothetical protein